MQRQRKAPVSPTETSRGQKKTTAQLLPRPFSSAKLACPRIARRVQSRIVDCEATAGWPWDAQVSLMLNAFQVHIERAEARQRVAI